MKRKEVSPFSIAFLDLLTGALGAVIILYVAVPKGIKQKADATQAPPPKAIIEAEVAQKEMSLKLEKVNEDKNALSAELQGQTEKLFQYKNEVNELKSKIKELEDGAKGASTTPAQSNRRGQGLPVDVGFKFKGKDIVFIVDVSTSMLYENRMGQVAAGLKMLITSMPKDYHVDVIAYPNRHGEPWLWGRPKAMTTKNKQTIFEFLYDLTPRGSTPTIETLIMAFNKYHTATDFVILSDGQPTDLSLAQDYLEGNVKSNGERRPSSLKHYKAWQMKQKIKYARLRKLPKMNSVIKAINKANKSKIQVNAIGVGLHLVKKKQGSHYDFIKKLSESQGGFYYGF